MLILERPTIQTTQQVNESILQFVQKVEKYICKIYTFLLFTTTETDEQQQHLTNLHKLQSNERKVGLFLI